MIYIFFKYTVTSTAHYSNKELNVTWYIYKNSNRTLNTDVLAQSATRSRHRIEVGYGVITAHVVHEHRSLSICIVCSPTKTFFNVAK